MLSIFCDITNTLCQAILFVWVTHNIAKKENKISKVKSLALMTLIFAEVVTFTYSGTSIPFANFMMVVIILLLILIFYRKSILDGFVGFGLGYGIIAMLAYFLITLYQKKIMNLSMPMSEDVKILLFIYAPAWIIYIVLYKLRTHIFGAAVFLKNLKHSIVFVVLIDFALIILDTVRIDWSVESMEVTFKFFIYLLAFITFTFATIYFAKVNNKSKEVEMLNLALNDKITELRKIKHDYGSEISTLYGLYQLQRFDRVGEILKGIVEKYQTVTPMINANTETNPVVASVLQFASSAGINVISIDNADYSNISITDGELLKLLSNIVRNSVDALKGVENPTIKFKSYNTYEGLIITIANNGPEIPKEIRNKIFQTGFTTKQNNDKDRGYGLSIVSDIIDKCDGKIIVQSNDSWTQFKIEVPQTAC